MPLYPKPHSPEWFHALEAFNPKQATITRQIIKLAGREDVCSICGDDPAKDFQIIGGALPDNAVGSIRLCEDCRHIRTETHGEEFVPLAQ